MALLLPLAMGIALLVDRLLGEPPVWCHPVVGMGRYLDLFGARLSAMPPAQAFLGGALVWLFGALMTAALALSLELALIHGLQPWSSWSALLGSALLLGLLMKPLLAWAMLVDEVLAVERALGESLAAGRSQLARLVSRDTSALDETAVREAAIETLAENLNDSVIAPLFWFAIAGLPGAALYRFANTADAMWGYRDHREWFGKWTARADDVLSWIPARITALALIGLRPQALLRLITEARRTPSPNSGWPMAAMALRLNLRLAKPGVYALNAEGNAPLSGDLLLAASLARRAMLGSAFLLAFAALSLRLPA
ncbi:adenosylcobinamide-phosphate synthase CbiB [Paucibacter sp. Y2R2-4]|uniref:adenosylcobinamide-phosphate synthase CbiB n=1 Tax=Paucibacter sp. Y2R2-4 TaxID=2893553 RepID=UPI0021E50775|nr:adenosylcobinamide-phosphate synthase CbiB [Paucibacter sp. Y2R2-4]MCV2349906.1 adenosylcobinamide-phosphate synthase CbiB [Paucibacter sp. Y2R2-4]